MTDITVKEFSKTVGLSVTRLIDQLELAGVEKKKENDLISDEEKMQLLNYVRNNQNKKSTPIDNTESSKESEIDIKQNDKEKSKSKTVIRKKRVFSKVNNQITKKDDAKINSNEKQLPSDPEEVSDIANTLSESELNQQSISEIDQNQESISEDGATKSNNQSEKSIQEDDKSDDSSKKRRKKSKTKFVNEDKSNASLKPKNRRQKILLVFPYNHSLEDR